MRVVTPFTFALAVWSVKASHLHADPRRAAGRWPSAAERTTRAPRHALIRVRVRDVVGVEEQGRVVPPALRRLLDARVDTAMSLAARLFIGSARIRDCVVERGEERAA